MAFGFPKTRRVLAAGAAASACALPLVAAPEVPAASACDAAHASPSDGGKRRVVRATLCLLNAERSRRGLNRLRLDRRLSGAASRHAADMVRKGYFSHDSLDGTTFLDRIRRSGYLEGASSWRAGENIAWGSGTRATPRAIARAWMASPGHRANILSRSFRDIGIGIARGAPDARIAAPAGTYATDFGWRG